MKKHLIFIFISTAILQFIFYTKNKKISMTLERPVFLVTDPRKNYSEIYPMYPFSSATTLRFSKTTVRLIRAGSKIIYTGKLSTSRRSYNIYKFEGQTLLLEPYLANIIFRNPSSGSLAYAIENNQKLVEQIIRNKEIDTEICFQTRYYYNDSTFYLKEMLREYNLEKDVQLKKEKEVVYNSDRYSCTNAQITNAKTYFFVSQFISNENI